MRQSVSDKNPKHGPRIGSYLGKPIFEYIHNQFGTYIFDRIGQCVDNEYPLDQLEKGEVLMSPGLIYKMR
jgi:hypothetical protein